MVSLGLEVRTTTDDAPATDEELPQQGDGVRLGVRTNELYELSG